MKDNFCNNCHHAFGHHEHYTAQTYCSIATCECREYKDPASAMVAKVLAGIGLVVLVVVIWNHILP